MSIVLVHGTGCARNRRWVVEGLSATGHASSAAGQCLRRLPALDPMLEEVDLCRGPGAIARHRALSEACEDGIGVLADVVVGPEVEAGRHRLSATFAEQRLDVGLEPRRSVGPVGHAVLLMPSSHRPLGDTPASPDAMLGSARAAWSGSEVSPRC